MNVPDLSQYMFIKKVQGSGTLDAVGMTALFTACKSISSLHIEDSLFNWQY